LGFTKTGAINERRTLRSASNGKARPDTRLIFAGQQLPAISMKPFTSLPVPLSAYKNPLAMEPDDFQTQTNAFLQWLSNIGVRMSPKMELVDLRSECRGRGVRKLTSVSP
jgi:hypothetical protein